MFYKKDIMKIEFQNISGNLKVDMVALYNGKAISEEVAKKVILEGSHSDDVVIITKDQFDSVIRGKRKELH